jgi:NAD(P)-dependent dehydrogenase (short-subunit alcohol dehydrogenase family)
VSDAPDLRGHIAVVTGASRGIGRGIAVSLGGAGATVYVTGRTVGDALGPDDVPGTVDATAREVTARGGHGIAVRCDHTVDSDVDALATEVGSQHGGRLDLLVNSVWGGYEQYDHLTFAAPFWEQPVDRWNRMFDAGVRAAFVTTRALAPLLIARGRGLVIHLSSGDRDRYRGSVPYDVAKTAVERMAAGMAHELYPYGVAALALQPGFTDTERVRKAGGRGTETAEYTGRVVVALAADPDVFTKRSGAAWPVGLLAREYDVTDVDGSQPEVFEMGPEYVLRQPSR